MDQKPKARKPPGKRTKPKESQKKQSELFIETARRLGVDESGREFDRALAQLVDSKQNE